MEDRPRRVTITLAAGLDGQRGGDCLACYRGIAVRPQRLGVMICAECGEPVTTILLERGAGADCSDQLPEQIGVRLNLA